MGGKSGASDQTVTQTNLPEYARPFVTDLFRRAEAESRRPYTPYRGERLAREPRINQEARGELRRMGQGLPGISAARQQAHASKRGVQDAAQMFSGIAGMAPEFDADTAYTRYSGFDPYGGFQESGFSEYGFGPAGTYLGGTVDQYMSPYMQNVVDVQKQQAQLDFDRAQAGRDAAAVQAGAFGGTRGAVVDALAQEDLARRMAEIQATGQQSAFETGAELFERDRAARTGIEALAAQERGRVEEGRAAEAGRVQGMTAEELARIQEGRASELARVQQGRVEGELAFGELGGTLANLAASGRLDAAIARGDIGDDLARYGAANREADMQRLGMLQEEGGRIEDRAQRFRDMRYQDFLRQQGYPMEQLSSLSDIIRGNTRGYDTRQTLIQQTNPYREMLGAGISALSLRQAGVI